MMSTVPSAARSLTLALILFANVSCGTAPPRSGTREVSSLGVKASGVSQAELQQDVQRFAGEFHERIVQALQPILESKDTRASDRALRQALLYSTSAIDIATGPSPEVNLLDMIFFVRLSRIVVESHWIPDVYHEAGRPLLAAFEKSEKSLWAIAGKVIDENGKRKLIALIDRWRTENPDQYRVELVRFSDFSHVIGAEADAKSQAAGGLLASVKSAVVTGDAALLLAERSLFLAQRMPFLLRMQAWIASRDIVSDFAEQGQMARELLASVGNLRPLVGDTADLANSARQVAHESRLLADTIANDLLPPKAQRFQGQTTRIVDGVRESLFAAERLLDRVETLVSESRTGGSANAAEPAAKVMEEIDRFLRRGIIYLFLLGCGWALVGWGGYYLAKTALNRDKREREFRAEAETSPT